MAESKMVVVAFLLVSLLVFSAAPAVTAYGCLDDCIQRCSNGKNLVSCNTMCATACVTDAARKATDSFIGN